MDVELLTAMRRLAAPEGDDLARVRGRAEQVTTPPDAEVGALLALVSELVEVRHAVEIGAAGGVTGAWLLRGMAPRGVLTSIEADVHLHGLATAAYADLGLTDRVRAIVGDAPTVVGRLSDGQYDLVLLQEGAADLLRLLAQAERLLRPGGLLVARRMLASDGAPSADMLEPVGTEPWSSSTVLGIDGGLLIARLGTSDAPEG